jgi:S1-C subfamily serine protease
LVDSSGFVIGVNTANIPFAQGIGFAIPINAARRIAKEIIEHGRVLRPYLGIAGITLNPEISGSYNIPYETGVLVVKVSRGSPAHRSGMQAGDTILEADSRPLKGWEDLQHILQTKKVGDRLGLIVARDERKGRIDVQLEEVPS